MFKLHLDAMCLGNIFAVQMAIFYRLYLALWLSFEYSETREGIGGNEWKFIRSTILNRFL